MHRQHSQAGILDDRDCINFCEFSLFEDALEELPADGKLERQIIFRSRLEPFVEFDLSPEISDGTRQTTRKRTMFRWSSPFRTSISPHTLSSFPLTFFFGMIFSATSFVMPLTVRFPRPGDDGRDEIFAGVRLPSVLLGDMGLRSAAAPRSAVSTCSSGTCHVAFCKTPSTTCKIRNERHHTPRLCRTTRFRALRACHNSSSL